MTITYREHVLERLLKNNDRAHEVYMSLLEDSEDGKVYYTWRDLQDKNYSRLRVRKDLNDLYSEGLVDFFEDTEGFTVRLTAE